MNQKQLLCRASEIVGVQVNRGQVSHALATGALNPTQRRGTWNLYTEDDLDEFVSYLKDRSQKVAFSNQ